ncbi:MAG: hypothetical protein ACN4GT_02435 [Gammaproteobacteria bacterium]
MESLRDIIERQQQASPTYFDDPQKDAMLRTILSLAEEVCVLRDRVDTCRRLADAGQPASDAAIDAFDVADELLEQRLSAHTEFFEATLARLLSEN